eukprot:scaffold11.g3947.t1
MLLRASMHRQCVPAARRVPALHARRLAVTARYSGGPSGGAGGQPPAARLRQAGAAYPPLAQQTAQQAQQQGYAPTQQQQQQQQQNWAQLWQEAQQQAQAPPPNGAPPAQPSAQVVLAPAGQQPAPPEPAILHRYQLMDKGVITRTSAIQLGYVNQIFVEPASLSVVSLYLRPGPTVLTGAASVKHVLLSSVRQIGDVILVHDKYAISDPAADENAGCVRLVGAEVVTKGGASLGKVRGYSFDPDSGALLSITYDLLGVPSLPAKLLSCYEVPAYAISSAGVSRVILHDGAERLVTKLNDGLVNESVRALVAIVSKVDGADTKALPGAAGGAGDRDAFRTDAAYAEWYAQHGLYFQQYYNTPVPAPVGAAAERRQQSAARGADPRARAPRALPPPRATPFAAAVQPAAPAWQAPPAQQAASVGGGAQPPLRQQQARGAEQSLLLDVQRRPVQQARQQQAAPPPPQQQQVQQQRTPTWPPAPPPQPAQQPAQQQQQPYTAAPTRRARRPVVQPDEVIPS